MNFTGNYFYSSIPVRRITNELDVNFRRNHKPLYTLRICDVISVNKRCTTKATMTDIRHVRPVVYKKTPVTVLFFKSIFNR